MRVFVVRPVVVVRKRKPSGNWFVRGLVIGLVVSAIAIVTGL